ncbi:MAG: phosphotransferase [Gemmatimonadaceae bacterium]
MTVASLALDECLPPALRGEGTTFTRLASGLSGAGVHRVNAAGTAAVLKISRASEPLDAWRARTRVQQLAADAGVAPAILHVDEARRAVVSEFVADRGFPGFLMTPATRADALVLLGRTMRRIHDLPAPAELPRSNSREFLAATWSKAKAQLELPSFVETVVTRALAIDPPAAGRADGLSHNDANPGNMVFDGERLMLVDWDTAGVQEPFYDLATIALFFRLDEAACLTMLAAHDGAPAATLPPRFTWDRRTIAALCGSMGLWIAGTGGHPGAAAGETLENAPTLVEFYQRMRAGEISHTTPKGQWAMGMAMIRESAAIHA